MRIQYGSIINELVICNHILHPCVMSAICSVIAACRRVSVGELGLHRAALVATGKIGKIAKGNPHLLRYPRGAIVNVTGKTKIRIRGGILSARGAFFGKALMRPSEKILMYLKEE